MKYLLLVIPFLLLEVAQAKSLQCDAKKTTIQQSLVGLSRKNCEETKASARCQNLYKKIKDDGGELSEKALRCEVDTDLTTSQKFSVSYITCLKGGLVDGLVVPVKQLGEFLGESTAKAVISIQQKNDRMNDCKSNPETIGKIYSAYNKTVPDLLKLKQPNNFLKYSCSQAYATFEKDRAARENWISKRYESKRNSKPATLSKQENEYLNWKFKDSRFTKNNDSSLIEMAEAALDEYDIHIECYNLEARAALRCQALFDIATLGLGAPKLAMSALSGLKVSRFAAEVSQIAAKSQALKGISEADKIKILMKANKLNDSERTDAAELLLTRSMTAEQKKALIEAHKLKLGNLKGKAEILKNSGFTAEERNLLMRSGITGEFDDYLQAAKMSLEKEQKIFSLMDKDDIKIMNLEAELRRGGLSPQKKLELETEIKDSQNNISTYKDELFGGDVIGPGLGPANLASLERRIGSKSLEIEIAEANGLKTDRLLTNRAKTLRESAEFHATGRSYGQATKEYNLAAQDIEKVMSQGGLKTYQEKIEAARILQNADPLKYREAYNQIVSDIARSPQVKNYISVEKMEFPDAMVNPIVASKQRGSAWDLARQYKDQDLRLQIQRNRNEDVVGDSWENNKKLDDQFELMVKKRDDLKLQIEKSLIKEHGSDKARKVMKEMGLD